MNQSIKLPDQIITKVVNMGNIAPDAELTNVVKDMISDYSREVAWVSIILSDNYLERLYVKMGGYMACIEELHRWAVEFVTKFAHVKEWDEFLSTDRTFGECSCWDDFIVAYGKTKLDSK